ncbi:hypothetical protein N7532_008867 [Penicillium argentinense]|uniref:Uncharacterized protein n=1 Tax=Penicillium argentinense TaxID=1131581 RepID=A0A9W9EY84_9EURO|nr:uncharacterized protein N7532_008867 [Penicillium argentinense]KAJ5090183.1 hypothetical protein N7532_008867 [Penicillium argentinense]
MTTLNDLAKTLRALHNPSNPLVLTNVYDAPTAKIIAALPTSRAVATASYAVAATHNTLDDHLTKTQNLTTLALVLSAVHDTCASHAQPTKPVTVDLQDGYGADLPELAATIKEIIALGAVGCNLEDLDNASGRLRPLPEAVARVRTVMAAAAEVGVPDFVLNARTDVLGVTGRIEDAVERGRAFREAGACTVFVWGGAGGRGVSDEEVRVLVKELEGMVNVKMNLREGFLGVQEIKRLGVARISVGPELWRVAMKAYQEQAELLLA